MQKKKVERPQSQPNKMTKQEKQRRMKKNKLIKFILKLLVLLALFIGLTAYGLTSPVFNINEIEILGNEKFNKDEYIRLSGLSLNNNIFNFRKSMVVYGIKQNAYVESVVVKRKLPNKVEIQVEERKVNYLLELESQEFAYINSQGYILEKSKEELPLTIITGVLTDKQNIVEGNRLSNEDLERLQDVIKIKDAINNAEINQELNKINIKSKANYILTFEKEAKEVQVGGINDNLSSKMLYLKYLLEEQEGVPGIIYLNQEQVYFSPK